MVKSGVKAQETVRHYTSHLMTGLLGHYYRTVQTGRAWRATVKLSVVAEVFGFPFDNLEILSGRRRLCIDVLIAEE